MARSGNAHRAALERNIGILTPDTVWRSAPAVATRTASLNDKIGHHPVERQTVVESGTGQIDEVQDGQWGNFGKQLDLDLTPVGLNERGRMTGSISHDFG